MGLKAVANLGGGGGGGISGSGTPGKLAKFTGAGTSIGDSLLSESGTTITSAATAETFGSAQTWTVGAPNSQALVVLSNAGLERTLVLDTISRAVGVGVPTSPATLLHVSDGVTAFAGTVGAGVRLDRATEALFSSSDGTRSFRAGITASTAVVGTSTAHDLLLQRNNVTAATLQSGAIASVTLTAGGAGYTSATYSQQALTGGTGTGATADIVVAGGIVTSCVLRSPGTGYAAADALSCATIGAGAGFVVTVATIAQIVAGSGNLTALGRIGAGTATPISGLDSIVGVSARAGFRYSGYSFGTTITNGFNHLVIDSTGESGGVTVAPTNITVYGARVQPRFDLSANTTGGSAYGVMSQPIVEASAGTGTSTFYGIVGGSRFSSASFTGKTVITYGVLGASSFYAPLGASNSFDARQVASNAACTAANAQTFSAWHDFYGGSSFSGAAHTITAYYGLRLFGPTLSGGSTVTNRWGISQEDTLASNQFSAVTNTFSGIVRATGSTAAAPAFSTPADTDTGMYFPSANTVRIGTSGSPGLEIDSTQNLKFNSGFGSTATAYGCRAWVNFIGATAVMRGSGGVSSLTRASAGNYTINFSTAMPDTGYAAIATKQSVAANTDCQLYDYFALRTTTSSTWVNVEGAAVADSANINIAFFR